MKCLENLLQIVFQVMECGWATLQKQIQRAESLDEMVEAHHQFLDTLIARLAWSLLEVH